MSLTGPRTGPADGQQTPRADVELRIPADSAYVSVLRTTTAGLAARLDFPIDDIEDLRIAVGEASAMVLPEADVASDLLCRFFMRPGELTVAVERELGPRRRASGLRQLRVAGADHAGHQCRGRLGGGRVHDQADHGVRPPRCRPLTWITRPCTTTASRRSSPRRVSRSPGSAARRSSSSSATRTPPAPAATPPATRWCTCTCRWWSTAPAASATAASPSRTSSRSARSA